jgi:Flp pilus assembly protein TadD
MPKHPSPPKSGYSAAGNQTLQRAELALQMRQLGEAEQLASQIFKANRSNVDAAVLLARALMMQNRVDEAIPTLQRAARRGDDARVETLLGAALAGVGRREEALELLRKATTRRPPFPMAFLEYANQLSASKRFEDAIAVLEDGLALVPDTVDQQLRLASLYIGRNDRAKARALLVRAAALAPLRADILAELGRLLMLDGDYADAVQTFRRALALRPDDSVCRTNLGIGLMEIGDRNGGEASVREAIRGRPEMFGHAIMALAASSHGRFFLRPSAAAKFLKT